MEKKVKNTLHVVVRYSENLAPEEGTVAAHEDLIKENGAVWMGKFGKRIGVPVTNVIDKQLKEKKPSYVFLTIKRYGNYIIHAGQIEMIKQNATDVDTNLIPKYYANKKWMVKTWFKITKFFELDSEILRVLKGKTSKLPLIQSLSRSMAGSMYATLDDKEDIMKYIVKSKKKS